MKLTVLLAGALALAACGKTGDKSEPSPTEDPRATKATPSRGPQVPPPAGVGTVPTDSERTPSGVAYRKVSRTGDSSERPGPNDTVAITYTAWKPDGTTQFTNVGKRPQNMSLATTGPGWREVVQMMTVGETWELFMTPELAFGERAARAPKEIQTYRVELLAIERAPATPEDVAAPPAGAKKTASGIAYRVLAPGTGKDRPRPYDEVEFHFTGWTTDGVMVDSSVVRKRPRKGVLFREMKGWIEAVQLMVVGEKARFWIPEPLTKTSQWTPRGMLVYDIELLAVTANQPPPPPPKDVAAPPANAEKTASGIAFVRLARGKGDQKPAADAIVDVSYTGWTTDGAIFDSSMITGKPTTMRLGRVIRGWTEAVTTMVVGDRTRFWIPEELGYKGRPGPQGTLVLEVELVSIHEKPKPPPPPGDVAAPPKDAVKTADGVYYKVLEKGTGTRHPTEKDHVVAHYTGWTTAGALVESSVARARPSTFAVGGVMKGWTSVLSTMVEGQKNRLWVPEKLAYNGAKGKPAGMLVFDIELIEIK